MSKFRAFELAIELATRQRDALAQQHAQAKRTLAHAKDQLAQLEGYAQDTDTRWIGSAMPALSGELIRHHYQFVDRLQQAVQMQQGVLVNLGHQVVLAHKALLQGEFRLAGLQQVLATRQLAAQKVVQRREQRQTDEFAALRHIQNLAQQHASRLSGDSP